VNGHFRLALIVGVAGLAAAILAGCPSESWQVCSSGIYCPSPRVCAEPAGACVTEEHVVACEKLDPDAPCSLVPKNALTGATIVSSRLAFIVGESGLILKRESADWQRVQSDTVVGLNRVWSGGGRVFAIGDNWTIARYDAGRTPSWSATTVPPQEPIGDFESIDGRGDDIWVVGDGGRAHRYRPADGSWEQMKPESDVDFTAVWIMPDREVRILSDAAIWLRYDGETFFKREIKGEDGQPIKELQALWVSASGKMVAVGKSKIVVYDRSRDVWVDGAVEAGGDVTGIELFSVIGTPDGKLIRAVGTGGYLFEYRESSRVWRRQKIVAENVSLRSVAFFRPPDGGEDVWLIAGENGVILEPTAKSGWQNVNADGTCRSGACLPN
jgi:photosystem II stability/assembly factor-like uncharacterized protein